MNRYVALLLLCLTSLISGCINRATEAKVPLVLQTKSQTVALVDTMDDQTRVGCTGVWVNSNTILTARHCVNGSAQIQFLAKIQDPVDRMIAVMAHQIPEYTDEQLVGLQMHYIVESEVTEVGENPKTTHQAKAIAVDKEKDLAIIQTIGLRPPHMSADIVVSVPGTGEEVSIVGHTKGLYYTFMKGTISNVRNSLAGEDKIKGPYVQIVAPIYYGNSGGGAFDSDGNLVGIASFMVRAPSQGFFIHPETIKKFLSSNNVSFKVAKH